MGFLTGAYGKLLAGQHVRQLQNDLTLIQSKMRRATREVATMTKQINQEFRMRKNCMSSQMMVQQSMGQYMSQNMIATMMGGKAKTPEEIANMTSEQHQQYSAAMSAAQMQSSQFMQSYNMNMQQQQQMSMSELENWKEMMEEMMLQPLKDFEEELQIEKDNKESQIKIAQAEYDAKKEEEKDGAKQLKPDYTGGGQ
jgi:hypothetical protein